MTLVILAGIIVWGADPVNVQLGPMLDNTPAGLRIFAPSTAVRGEPLQICVQAWDKYERLVSHYSAEISLETTDPVAELPANYRFKPSSFPQGVIEAHKLWFGDKGMKEFEMTFYTPGIHYVFIYDSSGLSGMSNPIVVHETDPGERLYWGDIHGHTSRCDGSGYVLETLAYARDVARCDFGAITNHDHFIQFLLTGELDDSFWEVQKAIINQWNVPGEFALLQGYEYRGEFISNNSVGDMCIYSRGADVPYFGGHLKAYDTPDLLFEALKEWEDETGIEVMAIPHHPPHALMGMTYDWSYFDPEFIHLVEIYSVHGNSEMLASRGNRYPILGGTVPQPRQMDINKSGYYIQDALSMGLKFGFMASGDSHDGHIGHSISHTSNHLLQAPLSWGALPHLFRNHHHQPNGMVAVRAPSLTRESIYDGLWARNCYAVKGVGRPYLYLQINGVSVGQNESVVYVSNENTVRLINFTVACGGGSTSNTIERIQIYKNNEVWFDQVVRDRIFIGQLQDTDPITGMTYNLSFGEWREDGLYYINEEADNPSNSTSLNTNGFDVYYGKMYDTEGGVAWIGPVWVGTV